MPEREAGDPRRIQLITGELFARVLERARNSPRLRMNYNFHERLEDNPNRFLNVMLRGSYFTPHRHVDPPKPEAFLVIEGQVAFFTFDDAGEIESAHVVGRGAWSRPGGEITGIDIGPGVWHTLVVLTPYAICYEVKPGPYSPAGDKDFAPWAPREGQPGAAEYLDSLLARAGLAQPQQP